MSELSLALAASEPPLNKGLADGEVTAIHTQFASGLADGVVAAIDARSTSTQAAYPRAKEAVDVFASQHALQHLGFALVRHLSHVETSSTNPDNLRQWLSLWESAAGQHEAMHLPLRLLRVGVDYLASQPRDRGKLLDLPAEERELLEQVLPPA